MKRKIISIVLVILFVILFGCSNKEFNSNSNRIEDNKGIPNEKKKIALVVKTLTNPFFVDMEKGARKAEEELGITLIVKSGAKETSIEQQINIIEDLITEKVDGIVIAPGSSTEIVPALKKAQEAKIPIVNIDNKLDEDMCEKVGLKDVPFISVDNEEASYEAAKYLSNTIKEPTELAILEGIRTADNAKQRKNGALRAFKENSNIKVIAMETANWKIDEAYNLTEEIFKKYPNVQAMFCANDMMALGASEYFQEIGKKDVKIAAFDNLVETQELIKEGKILVTVDQRADLQGYEGVKYVYSIMEGKAVPLETLISIELIDKEALDK